MNLVVSLSGVASPSWPPRAPIPRIIFWLGVLTLVTAAVILLMGPKRLDAWMN